ncbi:hypothetical protein Pen01_75750 [Phytomonospora endophytica]|nr:hypothetical protein Pen01_75750 [Phytomonospora endophytica]
MKAASTPLYQWLPHPRQWRAWRPPQVAATTSDVGRHGADEGGGGSQPPPGAPITPAPPGATTRPFRPDRTGA